MMEETDIPIPIRFKGSTLKTVFMLKSSSPGSQGPPSLVEVNRARIQIGLSPLKKLGRNKSIRRCYERFLFMS